MYAYLTNPFSRIIADPRTYCSQRQWGRYLHLAMASVITIALLASPAFAGAPGPDEEQPQTEQYEPEQYDPEPEVEQYEPEPESYHRKRKTRKGWRSKQRIATKDEIWSFCLQQRRLCKTICDRYFQRQSNCLRSCRGALTSCTASGCYRWQPTLVRFARKAKAVSCVRGAYPLTHFKKYNRSKYYRSDW